MIRNASVHDFRVASYRVNLIFGGNSKLEYENSQRSIVQNRTVWWAIKTTLNLSIPEYNHRENSIRSMPRKIGSYPHCLRVPTSSRKSFSESRARCDIIHKKQLFTFCGVDADVPSRFLDMFKVCPSCRVHAEFLPDFRVIGCFRIIGS